MYLKYYFKSNNADKDSGVYVFITVIGLTTLSVSVRVVKTVTISWNFDKVICHSND